MDIQYDTEIHHRRTVRLTGYDYSMSGYYHVVICTYRKECLFGYVINSMMYLNELGNAFQDEWLKTHRVRKAVELDEFIIMPNHLHGILVINNENIVGATRRVAPTSQTLMSGSLGAIIGQIKSITTKRVNHLRNTPSAKVWLRNYYEHIIRNEEELAWSRYYIQQNPTNWEQDEDNPAFV